MSRGGGRAALPLSAGAVQLEISIRTVQADDSDGSFAPAWAPYGTCGSSEGTCTVHWQQAGGDCA